MKKLVFVSTLFLLGLVGCTSVPMEDTAKSDAAKQFNAPAEGNAGLYVYRKTSFKGGALKKDLLVDGECLGETGGNGNFYYHEVKGGQPHTISTESEFSPNDLVVNAEVGKLYFIEQYIKMGVFVGGAGLKQVGEETGKADVSKLGLSAKGSCNIQR